MPNINEFIGPKPTKSNIEHLEKVIGSKPCFKCDLDASEYFWDKENFIMTWTCSSGHTNNLKVNQ